MKQALISLAVAACCAFAGSAFAAMNKDEYKTKKAKIEATYKADKKGCDGMKANAKDVCNAETKAKEKVARAELEASDKPSPGADAKVREAKADADYDVAKERCEDLKGKEQSACKVEAKAAHEKVTHEKAKGEVKAAKTEAKAENKAAMGNSPSTTTPNTTTAGQKK
ncbi:hypothetical protein [Variovorax sp. RO1]|uniref:hypothetical protein n=1 Tax=Variovorax sp. RO1 TaxID=2066034 RepID=UPI0015E00124|nr:hypothetical protein [Variovorax sp. RO1]